jgi:hypothetical protein
MGFLSKLNKSLGFSKGTKERARALKRREALGLTPKYVEDPMGRILSPRGRFNQSALERRVAEMTALNPGMGLGQSEAPSMPRRGGPRRGDMGMPRMPRIDDGRMRAMPIRNEDGTIMSSRLKMPQSIPEQMPTDPSSYYNPTIFGQQMGDMDFSQMPEISPVDMSNLQMPTLPREISQMDLPQMPEGLPSMQDVQRMPQMGMNDMQPRRMMAGGDEVFMPSTPEQIAFSIEAEIKNLMNEYEMAANNGENERAMMLNEQINELEAQKIEVMNQGRPQLAEGDEVFPDLTGDGKVTQADILKGRGVYAEGDEVMLSIEQKINNELKARGYPMDVIADLTPRERLENVMRQNDGSLTPKEIAMYASANPKNYMPQTLKGLTKKYAEGDEVMMMQETDMMAPGNQEIEASLMEVQGMQPDMQVLDQYVQMVTQMIQAGASEAEVIESLRQAGLDDDDIAAVFQAVMETMQNSMEQGGIDSELAQLG